MLSFVEKQLQKDDIRETELSALVNFCDALFISRK